MEQEAFTQDGRSKAVPRHRARPGRPELQPRCHKRKVEGQADKNRARGHVDTWGRGSCRRLKGALKDYPGSETAGLTHRGKGVRTLPVPLASALTWCI